MMSLIVKERLIALRLLLCARFFMKERWCWIWEAMFMVCVHQICELEILCIYAFVPLGDGATKAKNIVE
jgi:hypothetical protein